MLTTLRPGFLETLARNRQMQNGPRVTFLRYSNEQEHIIIQALQGCILYQGSGCSYTTPTNVAIYIHTIEKYLKRYPKEHQSLDIIIKEKTCRLTRTSEKFWDKHPEAALTTFLALMVSPVVYMSVKPNISNYLWSCNTFETHFINNHLTHIFTATWLASLIALFRNP